jgi:hypothetical protein
MPAIPNPIDAEALAILANGIIPADERDAGAAAVEAGPKLALRMAAGMNFAVYSEGLAATCAAANDVFGKELWDLGPAEVDELVGVVKQRAPGFYKQLRMDVAAIYLSDPGVWARMGFPGPSTEQGGYPDFDVPQG